MDQSVLRNEHSIAGHGSETLLRPPSSTDRGSNYLPEDVELLAKWCGV